MLNFYNIVIEFGLVLLYNMNSLAATLDLLISKFRKNSPFTQTRSLITQAPGLSHFFLFTD